MVNVVNDIYQAITRESGNAGFMITLMLSATLVLTHYEGIDKGALGKIFPADSTNPFSQFVRTNFTRIMGASMFLPTIIEMNDQIATMAFAAVVTSMVLLPMLPMWEYAVLALMFNLLFEVKKASSRVFILLVMAGLLYSGYITLKPATTT